MAPLLGPYRGSKSGEGAQVQIKHIIKDLHLINV